MDDRHLNESMVQSCDCLRLAITCLAIMQQIHAEEVAGDLHQGLLSRLEEDIVRATFILRQPHAAIH